ncbi:MAG: acetyl-CoA C-acetyltransferase [Gammaproteobacteria bacterium]
METRKTVYLVDGARTPFLRSKNEPGPFSASDLAVEASRALLLRQPFRASDIDEVITGCVSPSPQETNISRVVSLRLGCGNNVPAWTVQRNCASSLQAVDSAIKDIQLGRAHLVLAIGTEAMSHTPLLFNQDMTKWLSKQMTSKSIKGKLKNLLKFRLGHIKPEIALMEGLTDYTVGMNMGETAEELSKRFEVTREDMDEFAQSSQMRAAFAKDSEYFTEIVPIIDRDGKYYDHDTGIRDDSSPLALAQLKPVFDRKYGSVTAGNSSQVTDGAVALFLADEETVEKYDLKPLAKIVDVEWSGVDPRIMGVGPVHASVPLMQRHQLALHDIDFWEINEAFAGQVLACLKALDDPEYCKEELGLESPIGEIDQDTLNVYGGAIALGHPVGASGARLVLQLATILQHKKAKRGIASLCIGGGQGGAVLIESMSGENDGNE